MRPITVLVAGHRETIRRACRTALAGASDLRVIAEARNAAECLFRVRTERPHVVVLAAPPGSRRARILLSALSVARRPGVLVVVAGPPATGVDALAGGARGHLHPARVRPYLARAVRTIAQGDLWCSRALATTIVARLTESQARRRLVPTDTAPWSNGRRSRRPAR